MTDVDSFTINSDDWPKIDGFWEIAPQVTLHIPRPNWRTLFAARGLLGWKWTDK